MRLLRILLVVSLSSGALFAQVGGDVFARARRLVNDGDATAARALVDSARAAAPQGSPAYAEALYWRAVVAEQGESSRTDLLRVAIEFPLSPRASEALLRLAQMEFTRGDREAAQRHLERLARDHPDAPSRAAGRFWMGRLLLEDGKSAEACVALREARQAVPASDVELANQIAYYARPCDALAQDAKVRADSVAADSTRRASEEKRPTTKGKWSVQVAAFGTRDDALALAKKLKKRDVDARVTADKPWRVRIGHYTTRADAVEAAKRFSSKKSKALVVEAEGP
jgi:cell division septation protein DedD